MSTTTTNYGLTKQVGEEYYNVEIPNANMDTIDTTMKGLEDSKEATLKSATEKITLVDADALSLVDSADNSKTKKLCFANLKILLKTIFATTEEISALNTSLSTEITNRTNSVTSEATARANADTTLSNAIAGKQATLNFDSTPTNGSANPVTSGAVYTGLAAKAATSHTHTAADVTSGTLAVARGGTGVASLTGTDYTTNRVRGMILQTTTPSSIASGCLVGVYA